MMPLCLALSISPAPKFDPVLDDLSRKAFTFFWEQSDSKTGLSRDRANNAKGVQNEHNADVASIASTGYALAAYAIGVKRGWINRDKALTRAHLTLDSFLNGTVEGTHGWYYHFIDWKTGKRVWESELSSIDSGLLFVGALMADAGLKDPKLHSQVEELMRRVDWKWMYTDGGKSPDSKSFSMGWNPKSGFLESRWHQFCEQNFLYIMAAGRVNFITPEAWASYDRPIVFSAQGPLLTGGPLFMHQMSQGYYDLRGYRDAIGIDYMVEGRNATLANRAYCIANPKKFKGYSRSIWGLSACDIPDGYGAKGAPGWIDDDGTLAPAAAVASVIYTPELSIEAAKAFKARYPESYGRYGFVTGLNPTKDWKSEDVIGIDLGQMMLCIENFRDGQPWKWMMTRQDTQLGLKHLGFKKTAEGPLENRPLIVLK